MEINTKELPLLTKRQKEILDLMGRHQKRHVYALTLHEIAQELNIASPSTILFHLKHIEPAGYLSKEGKNYRVIGVTATAQRAKKPAKAIKKHLPLNQIILGDALEELRKLPDESADVMILDPPYNIGKDFGNNSDNREL